MEENTERQVVKKGRPKKERPPLNTYNVVPQEEHYLNVTDKYLPFSSSIRADQYLKIKRLEYHQNVTIRQLLETALEEFLSKQPLSENPLPEHMAARMKPLRTAMDYHYERESKAKAEDEAEDDSQGS